MHHWCVCEPTVLPSRFQSANFMFFEKFYAAETILACYISAALAAFVDRFMLIVEQREVAVLFNTAARLWTQIIIINF